MNRRSFCGSLAAGIAAPLPQARRPNLLIVLADDMGYGDIGCYGSPDVATPHLDQLARDGVRFTDGYVSCAVCSPSRVALLTGRYQHRLGHEFNSGSPEREAEVNFGLPREAKILPDFVKPAGYRTGIIGKWHLGVRPGYHPLDRGFDEFFGFLTGGNAFVTTRTPGAVNVGTSDGNGNIPETREAPIYRNREIVPEDRYLTEAFAAEAASFIDRHATRPFALYLAFNAIHTPLHATTKYVDRVAGISNPKHRQLAAMTVALDDAIGAVLAKVKGAGLDRDTLVVFLSDNGCPTSTGAGTNHPLNGEKVTYYEGGIRVPFMMRWPGRIPAGKVYSNPVVSRDILPTFLSAAGIESAVHFDGANLTPYVDGTAKGVPHEALFWRGGKGRAVRKGKWKLVEFGDSLSALYDLSKDVGEKNDLSRAHPDVVRELRDAWRAWSNQMKPPAWPPRFRDVTVNGTRLTWEL